MPELRLPRNSRFVTWLFLAVFAGVTLLLVRMLLVFLTALVLAAVLVVLFGPVFRRLLAWCRQRRVLAAVLTTTLVAVIVLVPLGLALTSLSREALTVYEKARSSDQPVVEQIVQLTQSPHPMVARLRALVAAFGLDTSPEAVRLDLATVGTTVTSFVYHQFGGIASNAFRLLLLFGLMILIIFALLADGPALKAYLLDLSPLPDHQEEMLVSRFVSISRAVFLGNGVASILQGFFGGIGFVLFGVGSGVLWGAAIAFFAFLPILGAGTVFVPASIYLYLDGHPAKAIAFLAYNAVYVAVFEYGLKPRLIGGQTRMSGVLIFLGILSGISVFGILGLFYGPLVLAMFLSLAEIYRSEYRADLLALQSPWGRADCAEARTETPTPPPEPAPAEPVTPVLPPASDGGAA